MLLKIYEFIQILQDEIGNGAEVSLRVSPKKMSLSEHVLEIRVDWWADDFHIRRGFTETEMRHFVDDSLPVDSFVFWCKSEYARKFEKKTHENP